MPALFAGHGFHIGQVLLTWHRFITIMVAVGLAIGLRILLFRTRHRRRHARGGRQP